MARALLCAFVPAVVTAILTGVALGERLAARAFDAYRPVNIAEAAGMGDAADVLRRLYAGENPQQVYRVRPHIISPSVQHATLLEAAMWSRRVQMFVMLDRAGVVGHDSTREALVCLAQDLGVVEVAEYLGRGRQASCVPREAFNRVLERTQGGDRQ